MVNSSLGSSIRLRIVCSWQYSRREILRAKVPRPGEHCQCGAQRGQGEQYIDRHRRAVQWTERFAPKSAPHFHLVSDVARLCLCRRLGFIRLGQPEIARQMSWAARMRLLVQCRSVCNSERSVGERGRAREELKTDRPGAATRKRFLEGEGEKAFWCHGGEHNRLLFRSSGCCRWCRVPGDSCSLGD